MKGLLHSRAFKRNLRKWLFMYVGTLCILTSVITYSKYMSELNGSDQARVASFNMKINYDGVCANIGSTSNCSLITSRPLDSYVAYFSVDTSEIETSAKVIIKPSINTHYEEFFSIATIYDITNSDPGTVANKDDLFFEVSPSDTTIRKYKVIINHTVSDTEIGSDVTYENLLNVGFSAIQKD